VRLPIIALAALALVVMLAPRMADAQQPARVSRVGLLSVGSDVTQPLTWRPFLDGMRELGYLEGGNLTVKRAFGGGRVEDLPGLAHDLARSGMDVIVTTGTRETLAARQAAPTTPIVMLLVPGPVGQGLVKTLARPGGTVTGLTNLVPGLVQKYVELLRETVPASSHFAVVANPPNPVPENRRELEAAAKKLGIRLAIIPVSGPNDFDEALARAKKDGASAIIATSDPVTFTHRRQLVQTALRLGLLGIYWTREYVEEGGLMTYSADLAELRRRAATYVDKILKGAKPADLPIEQPTKFELVINLKTAKALGLKIPPSVLLRADQVIE
jgi:putative tryptophan/tyrosine transport system substrate-binding protein